jgi:hypothetical protein
MQNRENQTQYRNIAIELLEESPTNPRKRFNEASLKELADYVSGHIISILCRSLFCARRRQTPYRAC